MTKYQLVELNQKKRKGLYIKIKQKNKPTKYYKKQKGIPISKTIKHYTNKKKTTTKPKPRKRRRTIEHTLRKGIKTVSTTDLTNTGIKQAKKRLFYNLIKDKELLNLLITEHNLQKIKHRFDYKLTAKQNNKTLFTAEKLNITPDQAQRETTTIKIGELIKTEPGYKLPPNLKKLEKKGWTIEKKNSGQITTLKLNITFRKA